MNADSHSSQTPTIGRTLTLRLTPTGTRVALGPLWAALCGACLALDWPGWENLLPLLLDLLLVLFMVEALWSSWRTLWVEVDWRSLRKTPERSKTSRQDVSIFLPYTTPHSPLGRLTMRIERLRHWTEKNLPPNQRGVLMTLPVLPLLIVILSMRIGSEMLFLSLAALTLPLIEAHAARRGQAHASLQAALEIGLSLLAGHLVFAPLTWSAFILACCYALTYQGALVLGSRRAAGMLYGGQLAAMILLIAGPHPLAASLIGLLCLPQALLLFLLSQTQGRIYYLQRTAPFIALSMLISAWAMRS